MLCPRSIVLPFCNFLHRNFIREIIRRTIQSWNRYFIIRIPWVQNIWTTFFFNLHSVIFILMTEAIYTYIKKSLCHRSGSIFRTETSNQSYIWSKVSKKRKERIHHWDFDFVERSSMLTIVPPKFSPTLLFVGS